MKAAVWHGLCFVSLMGFCATPAYAADISGTITFTSEFGSSDGITSQGTFTYNPDFELLNASTGRYFEVTSFTATIPTGETFTLEDYVFGAGTNATPIGFGFSPEFGSFGTPLVSNNDSVIFSAFIQEKIDSEEIFLSLFLGSNFGTPGAGYDIRPEISGFAPLIDRGAYTASAMPVPEPNTILACLVFFSLGVIPLRRQI